MAITGSGTQADPYIVHSYDEIKTACGNNNVFIELGNDIDCNFYGENFEWDKVNVGTGTDFDLKGHTIKNFKVKENKYGFLLYDNSLVHNGKILNVYLSRSSGFVTRGSNYGSLENLSISINSQSGISGQFMFDGVSVNACAIYVEGKSSYSGENAIFRVYNENHPMSNCDVLLNFLDTTGNIITSLSSGGKILKNCRIRGAFKPTDTSNALVLNGNAGNCVFDLETTSLRFCGYNLDNTGIINTDKVPSSFSTHGMTAVTSQEIISGASLRAKNFDVINVVG